MAKAQVTHRQHYVWQQYLEPWIRNGKIWWERSGLIKNTDTNSILFRNDNYKIHKLNKLEKYLLEKLFIEDKRQPVEYVNKLMAFTIELTDSLENISSEKFKNKIDDIRIQAGEDMISQSESMGFVALDFLKREEMSFFDYEKDDDTLFDFFHFVNYQYFRTKKVRDRIKKVMEPQSKLIQKEFNSTLEIDWEKLMSIGLHFLVNKITYGVLSFKKKYFIRMLIDNKNRLITSDQPVINTKASNDDNVLTEELEYYYPITPRIAILLTNSIDNNEKVDMSDLDVKTYNHLMFENRNEFVLVSEEELFQTILPHQ